LMRTVLRLTGIGWYVALCLLGGGFGGTWLDGRLGSKPILTLLGLGAGLIVAGIGMYRMLMAVVSEGSDPPDQSKE
jgi:hypothetical protein